VDTLVVWKLDRLARSIKQLIETVEDLEKKGIGFKSLTENIDTTTSGGKLIFHIFASLAEFERLIIKIRTKAMLADQNITVEEVTTRLKVTTATLNRHLPWDGEVLNNCYCKMTSVKEIEYEWVMGWPDSG